ncbi:transcriptional regulator [Sphingobium sp. H39-3-25]|uniref:3'-5' exonuclease n=1 Tax=Sphingobium arseniciresistens TaxID=3030834 RepID=UPI0023B982DB|nr:transcriptional regulator [Sphingobium arseniciresistens]
MKPITPLVVSKPMVVFLDFEASSLSKLSYPIEVAWVFENGASETHLIQPAPQWTDWDREAEAVHHIARETLHEEGAPHDVMARRMVDQLAGHDLFASAPSWDGKWLSALLRAAKLPRHALRLRDSDEARAEAARDILAPIVPADRLHIEIADLLALVEVRRAGGQPAHRALADAQDEQRHWLEVVSEAKAVTRRAGRG